MIKTTNENILNSMANAIIIPTNAKQVHGAGLALAAKKHYPNFFRSKSANMDAGNLYLMGIDVLFNKSKHIYAAVTKHDWRYPSRLEWIESILKKINKLDHKSISIPQLGCGLGGIDYEKDFVPLMYKHLTNNEINFIIHIYK